MDQRSIVAVIPRLVLQRRCLCLIAQPNEKLFVRQIVEVHLHPYLRAVPEKAGKATNQW